MGGVFSKEQKGHAGVNARGVPFSAPPGAGGEDDSDSGSAVGSTISMSRSGRERNGGGGKGKMGLVASAARPAAIRTPVDDEEDMERAVAAAAAGAAARAAKMEQEEHQAAEKSSAVTLNQILEHPGAEPASIMERPRSGIYGRRARGVVLDQELEQGGLEGGREGEQGGDGVTGGSVSDVEDVAALDPPILPSGELLEEGSKAWKLLGPGRDVYATPARNRGSNAASAVTASAPRFRRGRQSGLAAPSSLGVPAPDPTGARTNRHSMPSKAGGPNALVPDPGRSRSMNLRSVDIAGELGKSDSGNDPRGQGGDTTNPWAVLPTADAESKASRPEPLAFSPPGLVSNEAAPLGRVAQESARAAGSIPYWTGTRTLAAEAPPGWGGQGSVSLGAQTPPPGAGGEGTVFGQLMALSTPPRAPRGAMELGLGVQTPPPGSCEPFGTAVPPGLGGTLGSSGGLVLGDAVGTCDAAPADNDPGGGGALDSGIQTPTTSPAGKRTEAAAAAAATSPARLGLGGDRTEVGGKARVSLSAASTPKAIRSNSWRGGGKTKEEPRPVGSKTPGRLPRRLQQGMRRVKRVVGVG